MSIIIIILNTINLILIEKALRNFNLKIIMISTNLIRKKIVPFIQKPRWQHSNRLDMAIFANKSLNNGQAKFLNKTNF